MDLLAEKEKSGNLEEFYAQQDELDDLKNQIAFNMPGLSKQAMMGQGQIQVTEADGDTESSEDQARRMKQIKNLFK